MNLKEKITVSVESWKKAGFKETKNGTILIAIDKEISNNFWVHQLYPPLSNDQVNLLENELNHKFPDVYREFLNHYNGIFLFGGHLYIYGRSFLEKGMSHEEEMFQPYDLIEENEDPPFNIPSHLFYFGGSPEAIYVIDDEEKIFKLKRGSGKKLFEWINFESWLYSELDRLNQAYSVDDLK